MSRIRDVHEFVKFIATSTKPKVKPKSSLMRMSPRMKFVHGFVEYIHDYGMTDLLHEELEAKERRKLKARKLTTGKNAKRKTLTKEAP
ncbi:MAG: hypothetical protein LBH25_14980 [Fibromonadaceae bacterium]|jgi:hypothetical protein|nr:hypothetical protein [Fibromonadaceae bacterium]